MRIVGIQTARHVMIYLLAIDAQNGRQTEGRHAGHDPEDADDAVQIADKAAQSGGSCVAGVIPRLVDAEAGGKTVLSHKPQGNARNQGADGGAGNGLNAAGHADGKRGGGEEEGAAGQGDQDGGAGEERALGARVVGQGAEGRGAQQGHGVAKAHDDADFVGGPAVFQQVDAQKRPEAVADIRHAETEKREKGERTGFVFHGRKPGMG